MNARINLSVMGTGLVANSSWNKIQQRLAQWLGIDGPQPQEVMRTLDVAKDALAKDRVWAADAWQRLLADKVSLNTAFGGVKALA